MKRFALILSFGAALLLLFPHQTKAAPHQSIYDRSSHFGFFYSSLQPHGEWIELEDGFYVWKPNHIRRSWRPYLLGRWEWTNHGWYWMSHEPFGWVVFHYGRWYYDDYYGWVWIPGDEWAPAWVEWRYDSDYIGWAPLPPYAGYHMSIGIQFSRPWAAPYRYWNFVRMRMFGNEITTRDIMGEEQTRRLIRTTRTSRDYEYRDNRIINRGVDPTFIESRTKRRFEQAEVSDRRDTQGERLIRNSGIQRTNRIEIYRPQQPELQAAPERIEARRGDRRSTLEYDKIERRPDANPTTPDRVRPGVTEQTPSNERPRKERETPQVEQPPKTQPQIPRNEQTPRNDRDVRTREKSTPATPPQISKPTEEKPPKDKRRQLLERYDRGNPTPPPQREAPSVRRESSSSRSTAPAQGRTENKRTERKRD